MLEISEARQSLKRDVQDIFTSGSIFSEEVYNIYGEDDLRAGTTPKFPHVYLLDTDIKFEQGHLPVIAFATDYRTEEFQLGSNPLGVAEATVFVLGRMRGERDDFAAAIMKNINEIHIRDFDTTGHPILATVPLNSRGNTVWSAEQVPLTEELRTEGSLLNGIMLSCSFYVFLA